MTSDTTGSILTLGGWVPGKVEELLEELCQERKALKYERLVTLMERAGCRVRTTKEGCRITHPEVTGVIVQVPRPHNPGGRKDVKEPYVKKCIELLEKVLEGREVEDE